MFPLAKIDEKPSSHCPRYPEWPFNMPFDTEWEFLTEDVVHSEVVARKNLAETES